MTQAKFGIGRLVVVAWALWAMPLRAAGPFEATALREMAADGERLIVRLSVPAGHYLYADKTSVRLLTNETARMDPEAVPEAKSKHDPYLDAAVSVYEHDAVFRYRLLDALDRPVSVQVAMQGCSEAVCFPPARSTLVVQPGGRSPLRVAVPPAAESSGSAASDSSFRLAGRASGYLSKSEFLAFLDDVEAGRWSGSDRLQEVLRTRGVWLTIVLILLGGLALNLTPCVLPMIPVNLAIIGAGVQTQSKARGFVLGGAYGLGMALVYGLMGAIVVVTGATFGALNASPYFNLAIAAVFVFLALAMFGIIPIDFSRFQSGSAGKTRRGTVWTALTLGGVAALLAGACVAPVVISVLLLATQFVAAGNPAGHVLPFLLGVGMGLPWPFAGAGMAFLPRPGRWMERIKQAFGVVILLAAIWYGYLGVRLLSDRADHDRTAAPLVSEGAGSGDAWMDSLDRGLAEARRSGRPLFVDFWASWCKNCTHMEKTTFRDPEVRARLDRYVKVKFQAEDPERPEIQSVLDRYGVVGLPTYVVLDPTPAGGGATP
jgi:thiol:disulfide interchange protein